LVKGIFMPNHDMSLTARRQLIGRLQRLVRKELREILRDRRTIITLVVMPILIYPLLAIVFQRFLLTSLAVEENVVFVVGVDSVESEETLAEQLQHGAALVSHRNGNALGARRRGSENDVLEKEPLPEITWVAYPDETLRRHVADSSLHLAAIYRPERVPSSRKGLQPAAQWELVAITGL
jgi:hypothetical protein